MDNETTSPQTRIMMDALLKNKKKKPEPELKQQSVGRNAPCPCGSRNKFKKCCLRTLKQPIKQWVRKDE